LVQKVGEKEKKIGVRKGRLPWARKRCGGGQRRRMTLKGEEITAIRGGKSVGGEEAAGQRG